MTERTWESVGRGQVGHDAPRRDWFGRLLERLSRQPATEPDGRRPRFTPPLLIAMLLLVAVAGATIGLIVTSRGDETALAPTRMTLELSYPTSGEPAANLQGQPNAAPAGSRVTCRATSDRQRLGAGRAGDDGSFDITLDPAEWPLDGLRGAAYKTLNSTIECRAGAGPWTQPLRPPRVAIN